MLDQFHIEGETAIVTGASQGIGEAIAKKFADDGVNVAICSRDRERFGPVVEDIEAAGGTAYGAECDVTDRERVFEFVDEVVEEFGGVDVLVNNAGGSFQSPFEDLSANAWKTIIDINLHGAFHFTQAVGEVMRETVIDRTNAGLSEEDVSVIHNWADEDFIEPLAKADNQFSETHGLLDRFTLLYSGNIGLFHDLETVTRAMPAVDDDVVFQVIGEGDNKERIVEIAEKLGVRGDKVRFLPYQPLEDLPYTLTSGDVSIVTVKEEFKGICVSSKLYTSLAAGMPILAVVADGSDEAKIVNEHDAGVQVTQGETEAVAEAVEHWIADPDLVERQGWNARQAFETRFTKSESVDAYYRLLVE